MKKFFLAVVLVMSFASVGICDTVNTKQINTHGKINYILRGLIEMKTPEGEKKIWRNISSNSSRDIVTFGFFHPQRISGEVFFVDENTVEVRTHNGDVRIPRWKIRDISISDYLSDIPVSDIKK